jgi:biopolymer transport protein ExbD
MRKHRKHLDDETEVDMTPMLDIVFIMLIFFIVTTSFVKEDALRISQPTKNPDTPKTDKVNRPITIDISESDQVVINSRSIDVKAVRANVESARSKNPNGTVIIRAHPESSTGVTVSVYDQAMSAGAEKVTVAKAE